MAIRKTSALKGGEKKLTGNAFEKAYGERKKKHPVQQPLGVKGQKPIGGSGGAQKGKICSRVDEQRVLEHKRETEKKKSEAGLLIKVSKKKTRSKPTFAICQRTRVFRWEPKPLRKRVYFGGGGKRVPKNQPGVGNKKAIK